MAEIGACEAVIIALENAAPALTTSIVGNSGTVKALRDPDALKGLDALTNGQLLGKSTDTVATVERTAAGKPKVRIRYYTNETAASATEPICEGDPSTPIETDFTLNKYLQQSLYINFERMQSLCGEAAAVKTSGGGMRWVVPNTPVMNEVVRMLLPKARKLVADLNADVLTTLATGFGFNARTGNATAQNIALYGAGGAKTSLGVDQLLMDAQDNEMVGVSPILLGGRKIVTWLRSLDYACCSDVGVDYDAIRTKVPFRIYYDPLADTSFGTDQFALLSAGAHKLVSASRYFVNGVLLKKMATSYYGQVFFDELPGLAFDLVVQEDGCVNPGYTYIISLSYDVFIPPAPMGAGDNLNGFNGLLRYTATGTAA
jgi:hypothetical protein